MAMKSASNYAVWFTVAVLLFIRLTYLRWETPTVTTTLTWDALGYYMYLPGQFIYHDLGTLKWFPHILDVYHPTGNVYQICALPNGNYAMKYLMGLSILYLPFFFAGHWIAGWLGYPQDGFSAPYQLAICFAALFYAAAGLLILRQVLRRYFAEKIVALTILLVGLATNYVQYISVDSGQTHGFLFTLYAILLYATLCWHNRPSIGWALVIGALIGLSIITRPTEGVMILIPLLWLNAQQEKKLLWQKYRHHLLWAMLAGFLAILPQLIYWKYVTGNWIFDVGAKFTFFRPHWQVLFGWEKGWFIYTPVTILMILGLFFMKSYPFKRSVLVYCIMNIWIIIAWSDWRYGGSYSARALVQSYPVLALPLGIILQKYWKGFWKYLIGVGSAYLIVVNLFQIWQYNRTILHYNDMNRQYYQAIYLNTHPTPLDMSLLDTKERLISEDGFKVSNIPLLDSTYQINLSKRAEEIIWETDLNRIIDFQNGKEQWLHVTAQVSSPWGAFDSYLTTRLIDDSRQKKTTCRLQNGICKDGQWNTIEYYFKIPTDFTSGKLTVVANTKIQADVLIQHVSLKWLVKE